MRAALLTLVLLPGPALAQDGWWATFHTPSGNIHCLAANDPTRGTFVDCEVIETTASPLQPRPVWCEGDWGHRFGMSDYGPAEMICASDTVRNASGEVLQYGQSARYGAIACTSSEQGLECRNGDGHGFVLSRARQSLF